MKCTGERVVCFLVCLQVDRPFPVISTVIALKCPYAEHHLEMVLPLRRRRWTAVRRAHASARLRHDTPQRRRIRWLR